MNMPTDAVPQTLQNAQALAPANPSSAAPPRESPRNSRRSSECAELEVSLLWLFASLAMSHERMRRHRALQIIEQLAPV